MEKSYGNACLRPGAWRLAEPAVCPRPAFFHARHHGLRLPRLATAPALLLLSMLGLALDVALVTVHTLLQGFVFFVFLKWGANWVN